MGIATPLGYAYRFFLVSPIVIYILTYSLAPLGVSCFSDSASSVFSLAVSGMRIYGLGFLFSGINIFLQSGLCPMEKAIYQD